MALEPHVAFGDLLRQARRDAGLTQEELAERAGVSTRAVSNLERGINRSPHRDTLQMLVQALDLSPEEAARWERARAGYALRSYRSVSGRAANDGQPATSLPPLFTSFVGREQEAAEVADLLRRPDVRLVTLTGAGGIGKTRLALNVGNDIRADFKENVYFVPLAPLGHAEFIPAAIAQTLGVREGSDKSLLQSLSSYLHDRLTLLVLDNFEHLLSGVVGIGTLLEECPNLTILVTSRVPLRMRAEREYQLRSLGEDASTNLFVERSRTARPGFNPREDQMETIARICQRLDGLPLAIELAAARIKVLSPQSLLGRLDYPLDILTNGPRDIPARQQTLRNTIAWSYELLETGEQDLFRSLSVFMGGFTLEAAETIGGQDVLESLTRLVENSLVELHQETDGEPRFRMLETIREFGLELLARHGTEADIRERHARYIAGLVTAVPPFIIGPQQIYWLDRLEAEYANIQAALEWCLERDVETGLRMLATLWVFWWIRTPLTAGRQYFDQFLEQADDTVDLATLAAALTGAGIITEFESNLSWDRAAALHEQALSIWLDLPDPPEGAYWSFLNLGGIALRKGNLEEADAYHQQAMEYARRYNQPIGITAVLLLQGNLAGMRGNTERAIACYQNGLALAQEMQDPFLTAVHIGSLGSIHLFEGRIEEARPLLEEALALNRAVKISRHVASNLGALADLEFMRGRFAEAAQFLDESLVEAQKVNDTAVIGWGQLLQGRIALKHDQLSEALRYFRLSLISCKMAGEHFGVPKAVEGFAEACLKSGDVGLSVRLHAWSVAYRDRMGMPLPTIGQSEFEERIATLREMLAPDEFKAAWSMGACLTLDQILGDIHARLNSNTSEAQN